MLKRSPSRDGGFKTPTTVGVLKPPSRSVIDTSRRGRERPNAAGSRRRATWGGST